MKLLVLYEELAGYFIACLSKFSGIYDVDVLLIHKEPNANEAPFEIDKYPKIELLNRNKYDEKQLMDIADQYRPDAIFCGGWKNKTYLKISSHFKNKIPVIVGFDNKWEGTLKQHIASFVSPFFIKNNFNLCWVPGEQQQKFALKLGFNETQIEIGAYAADYDLFYGEYLKNKAAKAQKFPHRFIFVGRYAPSKGITDLWKAFVDLEEEKPNDWELWCLGKGDLPAVNHPKIKHFGFVQPKDISEFVKSTGVFVLPSHAEPWGLAMHEYASAGFPLICSNKVGSAIAFLEEGVNGYSYKSGDIVELKNRLKKVMNLDDAKLIAMGERSVQKAGEVTPEKWSKKLFSLINTKV